MDITANLPELEKMCEALYTAQDPATRTHAEGVLRMFSASADAIPQCRLVMDSTSNAYAQMMASSSLMKIVTEFTTQGQLKARKRAEETSFLFLIYCPSAEYICRSRIHSYSYTSRSNYNNLRI